MFLIQNITDISSICKLIELNCVNMLQFDINIDEYLLNENYNFSILKKIINYCKENKIELIVKLDFDLTKVDIYNVLDKNLAKKILTFVSNFISKEIPIYVSFPFCITSLYVSKVMRKKLFNSAIHGLTNLFDSFLAIKSGSSIISVSEDLLYKSRVSIVEFSRELRIAIDNYPDLNASICVESNNVKNFDSFILSGIDYVSTKNI